MTTSLHAISSVMLSTLVGLLIVLPVLPQMSPTSGAFLGAAGAAAGFLIGRRHRQSRGFFYFSLVCVLMLAMLVSFNLESP
ncbi:MAG: hypothetical protein QY326_04695 [Bdellovibrionota bacterium]|nr:MAG: hypothetical protein QY326_04695 [Bdellovibrionota bacterium]